MNGESQEDRVAARLRGFGPLGVVAALVVLVFGPLLEPFNTLPALAWIHDSRTPWREVGLARPKSWIATAAGGIALGIALKLVFKAVVMPLLGAPALNPQYHYLAGNAAALPGMLFLVIVGAGFGEELVFRGLLFERLGKLFGPGVAAKVAIVIMTSILFGAVHYPAQGFYSMEQVILDGLVLGTIFAITGSLWTVILAHAAFDVAAVMIIYAGWEDAVAHVVFK